MIDITKCPRDREVDQWFDEEFERQKTRGNRDNNVEEETPMQPVPKDNGVMDDLQECVDAMMEDLKL